MPECKICPRLCGADRDNGKLGYCQKTNHITVARASLHKWEEPCISGTKGSGTVFFSGCNLKCVYCQNHEIALDGGGGEISTTELSDIFLVLQDRGAHNINLVTPTHYVTEIIKALDLAKPKLKIPVVYNTSGYELVRTLKLIRDYVDIYLTDFKYFLPETAKKYSKAADYPEYAKKALAEIVNQKPACLFDQNGIMTSGVIVRNLLLPGNLTNSRMVIDYVHSAYGEKVWLSIMNQYTPVVYNPEYPELNTTATRREYKKLIDYARKTGVKNAYLQDSESSSEEFVPLFGRDSVVLDF